MEMINNNNNSGVLTPLPRSGSSSRRSTLTGSPFLIPNAGTNSRIKRLESLASSSASTPMPSPPCLMPVSFSASLSAGIFDDEDGASKENSPLLMVRKQQVDVAIRAIRKTNKVVEANTYLQEQMPREVNGLLGAIRAANFDRVYQIESYSKAQGLKDIVDRLVEFSKKWNDFKTEEGFNEAFKHRFRPALVMFGMTITTARIAKLSTNLSHQLTTSIKKEKMSESPIDLFEIVKLEVEADSLDPEEDWPEHLKSVKEDFCLRNRLQTDSPVNRDWLKEFGAMLNVEKAKSSEGYSTREATADDVSAYQFLDEVISYDSTASSVNGTPLTATSKED